MSDAQILSIAITVLAIFAGAIYNNSRIGDMRDVLRAEMRADRAETNAQLQDLRHLIERNQDTVMRMLADIARRVTRLEGRK